jgi:hypothetical protein
MTHQDKSARLDDVDISEIPLPPEDLTEALDNAPGDVSAGASARDKAEVAQLEFLSDETRRLAEVPLAHPFRHDGREIHTIQIRKLTVAEVSQITLGSNFGLYDIYAVMTNLPAAVLRGLMDDDGEAVINKAYDFLPRAFRAESG